MSLNIVFNKEDILRQTVEAKRTTFSKFSEVFEPIFKGSSKIQISRKDVFDFFSHDTMLGILSAFVWGFPAGGRGRLKAVVENLNYLNDIVSVAQINGLDAKLFEKINNPKFLNYATTTKFLYFAKVKVDGLPTLIFDQRVKLFIQSNEIDEFSRMHNWLNKSPGYFMPFDQYRAYLDGAFMLSTRLKISDPAIVEHYFFEHAPMKRKPRHSVNQ